MTQQWRRCRTKSPLGGAGGWLAVLALLAPVWILQPMGPQPAAAQAPITAAVNAQGATPAAVPGAAAVAGPAAAKVNAELPVVELWEGDAPGALGQEAKDRPRLTIYRPEHPDGAQGAIVVCPGGGYGGLAMGHEGEAIGKWLSEAGLLAAVLEYRHAGKGYRHPVPLGDVQRALRVVRHHAAEWQVRADRIGVLGFSAGGHLASSLSTHFDAGQADATDPVERLSCRPDFAILCYPVIALGEPYTHRGSQQNLLGPDAPDELVKSLSNEKQVTPQTPPTFLFHTAEDQAVPVENSLVYFAALQRAKVASELHVFQQGQHGVGLAEQLPGARAWPCLCLDWLERLGMKEMAKNQ